VKSEKPVILVVEDEFLVRMVAVSIAKDSGFEVLSAGTADCPTSGPLIQN
jgi:CheY-like chemotaxis protein